MKKHEGCEQADSGEPDHIWRRGRVVNQPLERLGVTRWVFVSAEREAGAVERPNDTGGEVSEREGREAGMDDHLDRRTWGDDTAADATVMLIGKYQMAGEISRRLLRALPSVLVLPRRAQRATGLIELLAEEVSREEPGQQAVLDRLLDLLLVTTYGHGSRTRTLKPRPGTAPCPIP